MPCVGGLGGGQPLYLSVLLPEKQDRCGHENGTLLLVVRRRTTGVAHCAAHRSADPSAVLDITSNCKRQVIECRYNAPFERRERNASD